MKACAFYNPRSSGGKFLRHLPWLQTLFEQYKIDVVTIEIDFDDFDRSFQKLLLENEFDAIVGIGGDGTHFSLINALMRFQADQPEHALPAYAFIPFGTGNNTAKSLRLQPGVGNLPAAVANLTEGADYSFDLGTWSEHYFADALSIGLDARIMQIRDAITERLQRSVLRRLFHGYLVYGFATFRAMFSKCRQHMKVFVDGELWYDGIVADLVINNTSIYAGEFDLTPQCQSNDGRLDIALIRSRSEYIYRFLFSYRRLPDAVKHFFVSNQDGTAWTQGRQIEVHLDAPSAVQVDGELFPAESSFSVGIVKHAMTVKVKPAAA
jgi:diacylglycerol kinase family enzyme